MQRALENTRRAAENGIHVFWIANYELEQMLPHLQRLGYQPAFAEGPGRYLRQGPHQDAAPLDPVFWRGITGAHGELVARLSRESPIDGLLYDTEHYAGGMMRVRPNHSLSLGEVVIWGVADGEFQASIQSGGRTLDIDEGRRVCVDCPEIRPHACGCPVSTR